MLPRAYVSMKLSIRLNGLGDRTEFSRDKLQKTNQTESAVLLLHTEKASTKNMLEMFFLIRSRAVPYQISRTIGLQLSWSDDYNTKLTIREPKMHHIIRKDAKIMFFTSREGFLETRNQSSDHRIRIFRVY
ncbi:hypothetical protein ACB098_05G063400 [Castanea mollissima]